VIAAGTLSGVFLSQDGGQAWRRIAPRGRIDLRSIESAAFDPVDPRILYVGTRHLGWKTLDAGAEWMPVHRGMIDDSHVMTLTVDPRYPKTVYATACTGIYRSTDGAAQWTKIEGIPDSSRRTRAFLQDGESNRLLAGTTQGLWISEEGGAWRCVTPRDLVINAMLVQQDGTIVLGTEDAGVLRSSDRGRTWRASNDGFSERFVSRLVFDTAGQRTLVAVGGNPRYGGVFEASDPRGPWRPLGEGLEGRQVLSLAVLGDAIVAGTDDGIFTLSSSGTTWTRLPTMLDRGETRLRVTELLARSPARLLAATSRGMIRSLDGGRSWTQPDRAPRADVLVLAAATVDADDVVAATAAGLFTSDDGGGTWTPASPGLRGVTPHAIAFLPSDERVLLATTSRGLFRSDDRGAHWQRLNGGVPHSDLMGLTIHPDGQILYASDFSWGGIFRSVDGGVTWARIPTDGLASERVWTMGLDPAAPERLLVSSSAGGLHLRVPEGSPPGTSASLPVTEK